MSMPISNPRAGRRATAEAEPRTLARGYTAAGWKPEHLLGSRDFLAAGGGEEGIPFFAGERHVVGFGTGADARGFGRADDRLHAGRMAENPREQDGLGGDFFGGGEFGDEGGGGVNGVGGRGVGGGAQEPASADGRPRLDENLVAAAIIEGAGGEVGLGGGAGAVGEEAFDDKRGLGEGELKLVHHERLAHVVAEEFDLAGRVVAHSEVTDFAGAVQLVEGTGDFGGFDERVGAVEQEDVEVRDLEAAENAFGGTRDVVVAEIVAGGFAAVLGVVGEADADLGLEDDAVAQAGRGFQDAAEELFGFAGGVDVGVVKEVDAAIERGADGGVGGLFDFGGNGGVVPGAAHAHAAKGDAGNSEVGLGDAVGFHGETSTPQGGVPEVKCADDGAGYL